MVVTRNSPQYAVTIPDKCCSKIAASQEITVSMDAQGRLIITPIEQVCAILMKTFGLWANRTDIPQDDVEYVNKIRHGKRFNVLQ